MKAFFLRLTGRFDALERRERYLVAVALLGGLAMLVWSALIDPERSRQLAAERALSEQRAQLATLAAQTQALQAPGQSPEAAASAELADLRRQLNALYARYQEQGGTLVAPQQVGALLEELLGRSTGLRLIGLRTLPVAPVLAGKAADKESAEGGATAAEPAAGDTASAGLYKHGVEIRLEGSYAELAAYLERLERSPQKLLWHSVVLKAENQPRLSLTLTVYTLSLDRTWLIV